MVYADVPEHEGFSDGSAAEKAPRPVSTDGWLERISDQLQVFVDAINDARSEDESDDDSSAADTSDGDSTGGDSAKSADADKASTTSDGDKADAKKTPAKRAEVKGD